jgi:hypothetical protein
MTDSEREFAIRQLLEGRDAVVRAVFGLSGEPSRKGGRSRTASNISRSQKMSSLHWSPRAGPFPTAWRSTPRRMAAFLAQWWTGAARSRAKRRLPARPVCITRRGGGALPFEPRAHTGLHARDCTQDLRILFTRHPLFGEIDCYRCLLLLALHPARHAAQNRRDQGAPRVSESVGQCPKSRPHRLLRMSESPDEISFDHRSYPKK